VAESRLTIRGLRVRTVEVPMSDPHRTASGTITSSPLVLTDLLTDEGADVRIRRLRRRRRLGPGGRGLGRSRRDRRQAKIGYPDVREDVAVIRAIRRAAGDEMAVMVDYNQSLTPVEAVERARQLDDEGLTWIEEPTRAEDYAGMAEVARAASTPIQAGENWWGPQELAKAIAAGASDHVMPDAMKIGGVTGWQRAAAIAAAAGRLVSSHLFVEVSAHLLGATPTAHWLEYADWFNPVIAEPLRIVDGFAVPDDRPGSGIEWNEDAVARYAVT
jgi:mandelate racemase